MKPYILPLLCLLSANGTGNFSKTSPGTDALILNNKIHQSSYFNKNPALLCFSPSGPFNKKENGFCRPQKVAVDGTALYFTDFKKGLPAADFSNPGNWIKTGDGITSTKTGLVNFLMLNRQYNLNKRKATFVFTVGEDTKVNFIAKEIENTHIWGTMVQVDAADGLFKIFKPYDSDKAIYPDVSLNHPYKFVAGRDYSVGMLRDNFSNIFIITDRLTGLADTTIDDGDKTSGLMRDGFALATESGTPPIIKSLRISTPFKPGLYILYIGDSITEGMYCSGDAQNADAEKLGGTKDRVVAVSGRSGGRVAGVQNRLLSEITLLHPHYVSILIGTNGTNTIENLTTLCKGIIKAGSVPILNNIPWRSTGGTERDNMVIKTVRKNLHLPGAAFDKATSVGQLNVKQDFSLFNDGIHPNANGAQKIFIQFRADVPEVFDQDKK